MKKTAGFTLVEILVVISIIAILAAVVILFINPLELIKRGRDSVRIQDLSNLSSAINTSLQEAQSPVLVLCKSSGSYPCRGSSYTGSRLTNGSGWVKADLTIQSSVTVPALPTDPINNSDYHYTYCADLDKWELDTTLESDKFRFQLAADGGNDSERYEIGSNLFLIATTGESCEY